MQCRSKEILISNEAIVLFKTPSLKENLINLKTQEGNSVNQSLLDMKEMHQVFQFQEEEVRKKIMSYCLSICQETIKFWLKNMLYLNNKLKRDS